MKTTICMLGLLLSSIANAGQGTIMRADGETSSGANAKVVVIAVKPPAFEALRKVVSAEVDGVPVADLRESSDVVLEGTAKDGRPVVLIQAGE